MRTLGAPIVSSTDSLGFRVTVRPLSDGRVLVNDVQHFRVLLYDKTLKSYTTVLDSTRATGGTTFTIPSENLIPAPADSTLFVEWGSRSLLVFDATGNVAHVMALPRPRDIGNLANGSFDGVPVLDAKGRLVYRGTYPAEVYVNNAQLNQLLQQRDSYELPAVPDSAPIVRADFDTRSVDTLTTIRIARGQLRETGVRDQEGNIRRTTTVNPFAVGDAWARLPNGTIAILRAHDYHIDWVDADGTKRSSPKMAFDWKRLTDEDKQRKIDSLKPRYEKLSASQQPEALRTPAGARRVTNVIELLSAREMSDYEAPIAPGAMKVDLDGNLWIVPRTAVTDGTDGTDGLRYDVVNAKGEIFERVALPQGRAIAAFEPGGTVILTHTQGRVTTLERARMR